MYLNQSLRKKVLDFYSRLDLSDRDDYVEVDTLTQILKCRASLISTHQLAYL